MPYAKGVVHEHPGRPKGSRNYISQAKFMEAIRNVEKEQQICIIEHFIKRALENDIVLIALMKKILPDLTTNNDTQGELMEKVSEILRKIKASKAIEIQGEADGGIAGTGNSGVDPAIPNQS